MFRLYSDEMSDGFQMEFIAFSNKKAEYFWIVLGMFLECFQRKIT